ncbi:MAG: hypothetical protein HYY16_10280 [Planctomycetes bacterium]|nr:hypothetical protein [Planctomycetota bacterium]
MRSVALAVAWTWDGDEAFIRRLRAQCAKAALSFLEVTRQNLGDVLRQARDQELRVDCFLDRASDEDSVFLGLNRMLRNPGTIHVNELSRSAWAADKATMHLELLARGVNLPYSVIVEREELDAARLDGLDRPFVVKPAMGGGGLGVLLNATGPGDIQAARVRFGHEKLLIQQRVTPRILGGRRAWFRAFHVFGEIQPCWWDDQTHRYERMAPEEEQRWNLHPLRPIARRIADVCRLDFFSSEIALSDEAASPALGRGRRRLEQDLFVVIDYVNDPCDLRPQSQHADGVPDCIVDQVVTGLVERARGAAGAAEPKGDAAAVPAS